MHVFRLDAEGTSVTIDLSIGHLVELVVTRDGRDIRPLHRAPWADDPDLPADMKPGSRGLSGDFLCAPFSANDVDPGPSHGWSANSPWSVVESRPTSDGAFARFRLDRTILGATIEKTLTLRNGHPFLYQEHALIGGEGELPVAHHAMTHMAAGGALAFSPKRLAFTPDIPLEPDPSRGRYALAYPASSADLTKFPDRACNNRDLTRYLPDNRAEDFVTLVEADHGGPGWTAVARHAERDLVLVLKDPEVLPVTMLWLSDGGRDYFPWNGRHTGVLGIEDGRTSVGHAASIGDNKLKRMGLPTTFVLQPAGEVRFRQVIGVAALAATTEAPSDVRIEGGKLLAGWASGDIVELPYDHTFLG
jgi:hypothetical protein